MKLPMFAAMLAGAFTVLVGAAGAADPPKPAEAPNILGQWTGNWGAFDPATLSKIS